MVLHIPRSLEGEVEEEEVSEGGVKVMPLEIKGHRRQLTLLSPARNLENKLVYFVSRILGTTCCGSARHLMIIIATRINL